MGRAEGPARARFWVLIGGCAILGAVVGLVMEGYSKHAGSMGIGRAALLGAGSGVVVGYFRLLRRA